jgi:prepilin-type N-terminal cleavage/methylation domain-containing protein
MCRTPQKTGSRSAFTLVEMVVVLLIIAILASLAWSVTVNAIGKVTEAQTRTEISELETALRAFMADYGLSDPPPSLLILNEATPLAPDPRDNGRSAAFLTKVFGKNLGPTDWNGDGSIAPPNVTWPLQGQHCLVFYLGGIPNTAQMASGVPPSPQGFSTNNMNPALPGGKRKGPYYTFNPSRLVPIPAVGGFFVYLDPWQVKPTVNGVGPMPYVYFSSNGINNGYSYTDCSGLTFMDALKRRQIPLPYYTAVKNPINDGTPTVYTNSNTYQIISAGKDGIFGYTPPPPPPPPSGSPLIVISDNNIWSPASGATGPGADDQANFSSTLLGQGQN